MPKPKCLYGLCIDNCAIPLSDCLGCSIAPNTITLVNLLLITPLIVFLLCKKGYIFVFILLVLLRSFLDIHDGTTARRCNMTSKTGAILDIIGDMLLGLLVLGAFLFTWYRNKNFDKKLAIAIGSVVVIINLILVHQGISEILSTENRQLTTMGTLMADNSLIITFTTLLIAKIYLDSIH